MNKKIFLLFFIFIISLSIVYSAGLCSFTNTISYSNSTNTLIFADSFNRSDSVSIGTSDIGFIYNISILSNITNKTAVIDEKTGIAYIVGLSWNMSVMPSTQNITAQFLVRGERQTSGGLLAFAPAGGVNRAEKSALSIFGTSSTQWAVTSEAMAGTYALGLWYYVSMTYEDSGRTFVVNTYHRNGSFIESKQSTSQLGTNEGLGFSFSAINFRGSIDDFMMWNSTNGGCPPIVANVPITYTPNLTGLNRNMTNNSLGQIINFTCNNNRSNFWFGTQINNLTAIQNASTAKWIVWNLNTTKIPSQNDYYWIAGCNGTNGVNTSMFRFTYDTTAPSITIQPTTNIAADNSTILYTKLLKLNFTFTDTHLLYAFEINITNTTGGVLYNLTNQSLTSTSYNIYRQINITNWKNDKYIVSILTADSHNPKTISYGIPLTEKLYNVVKSQDKKMLTFNTLEKNKIKIYSTDNAELTEIRQQDKYEINVKYNLDLFGDVAKIKKFIVEFEEGTTARYIENSDYTAHLVFFNWGEQNGNYVDFVGLNGDIKVTKKKYLFGNEYFEIEAKNNEDSEITLHSIGGLNVNRIDYSFNNSVLNITSVVINPPGATITEVNLYFIGNGFEFSNNSFNLECGYFKNKVITDTYKNYTSYSGLNYVFNSTHNKDTSIGDNYTASCRAWRRIDSSNNIFYTSFINSSVTSIRSFNIDTCVNYNSTLINFSSYEENNQTPLILSFANLIVDYTFDNDTFYNFSTNFNNVSTFALCLDPANLTILVNAYLQYGGAKTERYYIENAYITANVSNQYRVNLYNFESTTDLFDLKGIGYNYYYQFYTGLIAKLQRYYPANNTWLSVQNDKIDTSGQFLFYIYSQNVDYRILWELNGTEIARTDKIKFICDPASTLCTQSFTVIPTNSFTNSYRGMQFTPYYNNVTKLYTLTWSDTNGLVSSVRLTAIQSFTNTNSTLCDTTVSSSSGSIVCNLSSATGLVTIKAVRTASPGDPFYIEFIDLIINKLSDLINQKGFAKDATLLVSLSVLAAGGMAVASPVVGIMAMIGIIVLFFFMNVLTFLTAPLVIGIVCLGIIVGYALRR